MPRKKQNTQDSNQLATTDSDAVAVAEPGNDTAADSNHSTEQTGEAPPLVQRPEWIDGPAQSAGVDMPDTHREEPPKNWGDPYKPIFSCSVFELGEHRRFKQRVFRFAEKPNPELLARLKEAGFTYRAAEQAWTIPANPDTRKLTDDMARELAGPEAGMSR
jgi:hypothetical protein